MHYLTETRYSLDKHPTRAYVPPMITTPATTSLELLLRSDFGRADPARVREIMAAATAPLPQPRPTSTSEKGK